MLMAERVHYLIDECPGKSMSVHGRRSLKALGKGKHPSGPNRTLPFEADVRCPLDVKVLLQGATEQYLINCNVVYLVCCPTCFCISDGRTGSTVALQ